MTLTIPITGTPKNVKVVAYDYGSDLVGSAIVKRIAEFYEHVQGHEQTEDVLAARIVDEGLDGDERAAGREGVVSRAD